jgi:2-polyprenyl-3-methyl-5-hydroxy-6-metoxy-1,4-benzoquinol methylase
VPFSNVTPNSIKDDICNVCFAKHTMRKFNEYRGCYGGTCELFICASCTAIYNATSELSDHDIKLWQSWGEEPSTYRVPEGDDFDRLVDDHGNVFRFFEEHLPTKFSGAYLEIGAGNGVMGVAALRHFDQVYVFDQVTERIEQTLKKVDRSRYALLTDEQIKTVEADTILIWHTLEHVLSPAKIFTFCRERLRPAGLLLLQVPILSAEHVYPGHYYFFNEYAFTKMAEIAGLEPVRFYWDHAAHIITGVFTPAAG